jgi:hypothetical protein
VYQLRVYTLRSPEALTTYEAVWAKHISSLAKYGVTTHGIWTAPEAEKPQLYALTSFADDVDLQELDQTYGASPEFQADVAGFELSQVVSVVPTSLVPAPESPLR